MLSIGLNNIFNLLLRVVGISSLLPSKRPEGWEVGLAKIILISIDNIFGSSVNEEIDFDLTSKGNIAQDTLAIFSVSKNWRLGIGISEIHTEEVILL